VLSKKGKNHENNTAQRHRPFDYAISIKIPDKGEDNRQADIRGSTFTRESTEED
jgi:hypothetical protein